MVISGLDATAREMEANYCCRTPLALQGERA